MNARHRDPALRFRLDGGFRIVQFTDTHLSGRDETDRPTQDLMAAVLDAERPDLVVLTGDVIEGERADPRAAVALAAEPLEARGVPWAAVFGNHDDEGAATRQDLYDLFREYPGCLMEAGPEDVTGVGNYVLPIGPAAAAGPGWAAVLYFLDSGAYSRSGAGVYAWLAHDQVCWYRRTAASLRAGLAEPLPALAFFHIPLPEFAAAWNSGGPIGTKDDGICCAEVNSGMFAAFHESGDVLGAFCGHDHLNDFVAWHHGIRLCYGRATGYGGYGGEDFPRGARVVELQEGRRDFRTHVRVADAGLTRVLGG